MRKPWNFVLALTLLAGVLTAGPAAADQAVEDIFEDVRKLNDGLKDYSADIKMDLDVRLAFLPYRPKVIGRYYHKTPDHHKLEVKEAPNYVKKYPNIFGWNLPKLEEFKSRVVGETTYNGRPVWHVELMSKPDRGGGLQRMEMWIDRGDHSILRQEAFYKENGRIAVDVKYRETDGFLVFDTMNAVFEFPAVKVSATATASYSGYKFNQNLPESFFASKE